MIVTLVRRDVDIKLGYMQTLIRTIAVNEAEAACSVICRSIVECCFADHQGDAKIIKAWLANKIPDNFRLWVTSSKAIAVGAFDDESLVGVSLISGSTLQLCYVVPEVLHRGVGKALLSEVEDLSMKKGIDELHLESTRTAEAFYQRNGFETSGAIQFWAGLQAQPMSKRLASNLSLQRTSFEGR